MRLVIWCCLLFLMSCSVAFAQQDSSATIEPVAKPIRVFRPGNSVLDSVANAMQSREKFITDSVSMRYLKAPDEAMRTQYADSVIKKALYHGYGFLDLHSQSKNHVMEGHSRTSRDPWAVITIIGMLLYTAFLNLVLSKDISNVYTSFYSKRVLSIAGKEEGPVSTWAFIGLFLLFCATFGLFLYQLAAYKGVYYRVAGSRLFIWLVVAVAALFFLKFLILKILGFVFDINKLVTEYLNILHLTYFNIAFVFLPVIICFSLLGAQYIPLLLIITLIIIIIIFVWQYIRSSVNIISTFRFHKFYLFTYLCALEICPVLILIKALNIKI